MNEKLPPAPVAVVAPEERVTVTPVAPVCSMVTVPEIVPTGGGGGGGWTGSVASSHALKVRAISVAMVKNLSRFIFPSRPEVAVESPAWQARQTGLRYCGPAPAAKPAPGLKL